jgi:hypothetical protein
MPASYVSDVEPPRQMGGRRSWPARPRTTAGFLENTAVSTAGGAKGGAIADDDRLAALIGRWPDLSEDVKQAILSMAEIVQ